MAVRRLRQEGLWEFGARLGYRKRGREERKGRRRLCKHFPVIQGKPELHCEALGTEGMSAIIIRLTRQMDQIALNNEDFFRKENVGSSSKEAS